MSQPELYVFAISHYCEKARWALDHLAIQYDLRHLAPVAHIQITQQLGAPGSSLPVLVSESGLVQGSSEIIDWAEETNPDASRSTGFAPEFEAEGRALEQRLDDIAGVHVRRYYYSEALVEHPETVLPIFAQDLAVEERPSLEENWGVVCQLMAGAMDLGREQWDESREIVLGELDWFDGLLADGRRFLVGDRFSRADIAAASLFAPLARPENHPTYSNLAAPPRAGVDLERWADRPTLTWIHEMYRAFR